MLLLFLIAVVALGQDYTILGINTHCAGPLDASCGTSTPPPDCPIDPGCIPNLSGDVSGPINATVFSGGTPLDTPGELVRRDSTGSFACGTVSSFGALVTDTSIMGMVNSDSVARYSISQGGVISLSDGSNPADVSVARTDVGTLTVTGDLDVNGVVTDPTTETTGNKLVTTMSPPTTATTSLTGTEVVVTTGNDNAFTGNLVGTSSTIQLSGSGDVPTPIALFAGVQVTSNRPSTHGLLTVSVNASGANYTVGDVLQVSGFTTVPGTVTVQSVDGLGGITSVAIKTPGVGYALGSGYATVGGTGTGATINLLVRGSTAYGTSGSAVTGLQVRSFSASGTNSTAVVTLAKGVDILDCDLGYGPIIMTSQIGLSVSAQTKASGTTGAIDIKAQTGGSATTNFGLRIAPPSGGTNNYAIQITSSPTTPAGGLSWSDVNVYRSGVGKLQTDTDFYARHIISSSGAPTAVTGTGAGTGGTVTVIANSNDQGMQIKVVTGTAPAANGNVFVVTFSSSFPSSSLPAVVGYPRSATAASLSGASSVYVSAETTNTFTLSAGATALAASTTYTWNFHVRG